MARRTTQEPDADAYGLFELPEQAPLPALKEPRLGAIAEYVTYRGPRRVCDLCAQRIHERGAADAPAPRVATKKRKGPNDVLFLCPPDAADMEEKDKIARKERDERIAANLHMQKGRRL